MAAKGQRISGQARYEARKPFAAGDAFLIRIDAVLAEHLNVYEAELLERMGEVALMPSRTGLLNVLLRKGALK